MRFALLGADPAVLPLLSSIAARPGHDLSHVITSSEFLQEIVKLFPRVSHAGAWDELLAAPLDAVLVAGAEESSLDGAKRLAAAGKRLAVFPHAAQPAEWVYELTLVDNADAMLRPLFAHRMHPLVREFREVIERGDVGTVHQIQLERERAVPRTVGHAARLSLKELDESFLADVDLLRMLGGDYNQVAALLTGGDANRFSRATVTLAAEGLPQALWTLKPSRGESSWSLLISGERGSVHSTAIHETGEGELIGEGVELRRATFPGASRIDFDAGAALLAELEAALAGSPDSLGTWTGLTRDFDLVAGAHRSIRKRRTVDLHFEATSERSQFKTQMAAAGCGVLLLTLLAVIVVLVAGAALDPRNTTEINAEAGGGIVTVDEFEPRSAELTPAGRTHVAEIAARIKREPDRRFPVLVEETTGSDARWNALRRRHVVERLAETGVPRAAEIAVSGPVRGRAFGTAMRVMRIAVWLPLVVFLLLQALLFVARPAPAAGQTAANPGEASGRVGSE